MSDTAQPTTTLAMREPTDLRTDRAAFEPTNSHEAYEMAKRLCSTKLIPKAFDTPEKVYLAIVMGRELGLSCMQAVRSIHVIEGKPSMAADLIVGLVKKSPVCEYFQCTKSTADVAVYSTLRKGNPGPTEFTFTMRDAQAAGVTGKDNWRKWPAAMLRARCATALARAEFPDIAMGLYDPEELERTPQPPPQRVIQAAPQSRSAVVDTTATFPETMPEMPPHDEATGEVTDVELTPTPESPKEPPAKEPEPAATTQTTAARADEVIAKLRAAKTMDEVVRIANTDGQKATMGDDYPRVLAIFKERRTELAAAPKP